MKELDGWEFNEENIDIVGVIGVFKKSIDL